MFACPHCGKVGMLILHGFLRGYDEHKTFRVIKARRLFCSNRNRRTGCGRTSSCRLAIFLKNLLISTKTAWRFLQAVSQGLSLEKAYNSLEPDQALSLETLYFFWSRFKEACHHIRSYLANHCTLFPHKAASVQQETIKQLECSLARTFLDPIAAFQLASQTSFV